MEIRPMTEKDLEQVCLIENDIFSTPWSRTSFENSLEARDNIYLVAEEDGEILGYCGMWGTMDEGQITNVAVKKKHRRKNIAYQLLLELMKHGREIGFVAFTLEVRVSNEAAINLYKKLNFEDCGNRKNYYSKPTEDAKIMWLR